MFEAKALIIPIKIVFFNEINFCSYYLYEKRFDDNF